MLLTMPESLNTFSSSRITDFLTCPRKYLLSNLMRLTREKRRASKHLVFGTAMHLALEDLYIGEFSQESAERAIESFRTEYLNHFDIDDEEMNSPKNLSNGMAGIMGYLDRYASSDLRKYEILNTELSGEVEIAPGRFISFRLDLILRDRVSKRIICMEHKTSSQYGTLWEMQWDLKFQMHAYNHILYSVTNNPNDVHGIVINGMFFYKSEKRLPEFHRALFKKGPASMKAWLNETLYIFSDIRNRIEYTFETCERMPDAPAFPRNGESCTSYGGCAFHDLCTSQRDILLMDTPPDGYCLRDESYKQTAFTYKQGKIERNTYGNN